MSCLRQFLYPSEEHSYKLIRFLVEKLSSSAEDERLAGFNNARKVRETEGELYIENWTGKLDVNGDGEFMKIGANCDNLRLISEVVESLNTKTRDAFDSRPHDGNLIPQRQDDMGIDDPPSSSTGVFNKVGMTDVLTAVGSMAHTLDTGQDAAKSEETAAESDGKDFLVFDNRVTSSHAQNCKV